MKHKANNPFKTQQRTILCGTVRPRFEDLQGQKIKKYEKITQRQNHGFTLKSN